MLNGGHWVCFDNLRKVNKNFTQKLKFSELGK